LLANLAVRLIQSRKTMDLEHSASVIEDIAAAIPAVVYGELASNVVLLANGCGLRATKSDEHGTTYLRQTVHFGGVIRWACFRILSLPDNSSNQSAPSLSIGLAPQSTALCAVHSTPGSVALDGGGNVWRDGSCSTKTVALAAGDTVAFGYNSAQHTVTISINSSLVTEVQQESALQPDLYPAVSLLSAGTEVSFEWSYTDPKSTVQDKEQLVAESSCAAKPALLQLDAATASSMALQQQQTLQARTKKAQLIRASAQLLAARQQHQDEAEVLRLRLAKRQWQHRIHEIPTAEQTAARAQQQTELSAAAMSVYREKWQKGCDRAAAEAAVVETAVCKRQQQAAAGSAARAQAAAANYEQQGIAQGELCKDVYAAAEAGVPVIYLQVCSNAIVNHIL
jgi:hypothetical protein